MNKTNTKPARMSIKMWRTHGQHADLIGLADGVQVCPGCGAVIKAVA